MIRPEFPFNVETAAKLLRDDSTFGSVLLTILLAAYGGDVFNKDVVELYADIRDDFNAELTEDCENRLNAILIAISTDDFFEDPEVFRAVCTSLYDGDLGDLVSGQLEDLTLPEILWAVYEVGLLRDDDPEMSPGVLRVLEHELAEEVAEMKEEDTEEYYDEFVREAKEDLKQQMLALGVDERDLAKL